MKWRSCVGSTHPCGHRPKTVMTPEVCWNIVASGIAGVREQLSRGLRNPTDPPRSDTDNWTETDGVTRSRTDADRQVDPPRRFWAITIHAVRKRARPTTIQPGPRPRISHHFAAGTPRGSPDGIETGFSTGIIQMSAGSSTDPGLLRQLHRDFGSADRHQPSGCSHSSRAKPAAGLPGSHVRQCRSSRTQAGWVWAFFCTMPRADWPRQLAA